MAETERDKAMRLVGQLITVSNMVEQINLHVPPQMRRVRALVEAGNSAIRKAMLAAWEEAEMEPDSAGVTSAKPT